MEVWDIHTWNLVGNTSMGMQKNFTDYLKLAQKLRRNWGYGSPGALPPRHYKAKVSVANRHLSLSHTSLFLCRKVGNSLLFLENILNFLVDKPILLLHPRKTWWVSVSKAGTISNQLPFIYQNRQPLLTKNIRWKFILWCLKKELVFHIYSGMSMHPFTGHYPKTEQTSLRDSPINTLISVF